MDKKLRFIVFSAVVLLPLALSQCMSAARRIGPPAPPPAADSYAPEVSQKVKERPGLGTQLDGEIYSDWTTPAHFYRKTHASPDAVASFHYNDAEGAKLMAEMNGRAVQRGGAFDLVPGKLRVKVVERYRDHAYDYYIAGGKAFVIGVPGDGYELKLENLTKARMEVVVSIDGLDVLDGQPASIRKRGYIIPARSTITVQGMRARGKLRSLNFGTVAESRAATAFGEKGARNVGIIGMACYEEDEAARRRARVEENYVRGDAQAFGR